MNHLRKTKVISNHRSYEEREPIEVRITPHDLVALSFPGPDRSIRMADLRAGKAVSRRYRNRRIGEFLKELDLAEGRSTGIPKILKVMKENGSPTPEFESDDDRTSFLIRLPVHARAMIQTTKVGAQSKLIMAALLKAPLSMNELVMALGLKSKTGSLKRTVNELLAGELIEYTIPDKPSSRLQKYRLSTKGQRMLGDAGESA